MKQKLFENAGGTNQFRIITESIGDDTKFIREGLKKVFASADDDVSYDRIGNVGVGYIRDINEARKCALKEARDIADAYGFTDDEKHGKFIKQPARKSIV